MSDQLLKPAIGDIDGVNVDFRAADAYVPGTLVALLNGQVIHGDDADGPVELGGDAVRMKKAPRVDDTLDFWFHTAIPEASPFPAPPVPYQQIDLAPEASDALDLAPTAGVSDEADAEGLSPQGTTQIDLAPCGVDVIDLVPEPVSSEVV